MSGRGQRTAAPDTRGTATSAAIGGGASSPPDLAFAFVGTILPDRAEFHGPAYSAAGQLFQRELLGGLAAAGLVPGTVYSFRGQPAFPRGRRLWAAGGSEEIDGMRVRFLPFVNVQPLKPLTAGLSLLAALLVWRWRTRGARHRLIHCVNVHMPPGLITLLAARLAGARISASVLDVFQPGLNVPDRWRWHLDLLLQRHAIRRLDGVMVVSPAIAEDFTRPDQPVCLIEGGVGERWLRPLPARPRPASAPFTAAFAGSLEPINCIRWMLDTMDLLPEEGFRLLLAGDGSLAPEVRERAARDPRVEYRGFLGHEAVREVYAEADVLLCVRRTGQRQQYFFPSKLMEYLASGVPVVTTAIRGVEPELAGVMAPLRDETPAGLAALLRQLAASPPEERQALGARARQLVLREKSWAAQGRKLAALLLGVARAG